MVLGVSCGDYRRHGAFAEYVAVPARILYKLPTELPFERAALTEAVSIAVHAVNRRLPAPDETAVVVGAGMIGLLTIQVLKVKGVRAIIAVDVDAGKLELAQRMRAAHALNATAVDVPAAVAGLTGGRGADVAFEVAGVGDTVAAAIRSVRKGGTVVLIGNLAPAVDLPLQTVVTREIAVLGSCGSNGEIPECIDLLARGAIDVDPIISLKAPLEAGPDLFARLYGGDRSLMKVILEP
jgi:L-iditol 2-dehydrogenase